MFRCFLKDTWQFGKMQNIALIEKQKQQWQQQKLLHVNWHSPGFEKLEQNKYRFSLQCSHQEAGSIWNCISIYIRHMSITVQTRNQTKQPFKPVEVPSLCQDSFAPVKSPPFNKSFYKWVIHRSLAVFIKWLAVLKTVYILFRSRTVFFPSQLEEGLKPCKTAPWLELSSSEMIS